MSKKTEPPVAYRKKLIEVALPLEAINKASAREKSIRHGHPSTLHLWWARRPLAACRAVLFASLVDDPDSDPMFGGDEDLAASKRAELFNLIEELVQWKNSNNPRVINRARAEIARCVATQKIEEGVFKKDDVLTLNPPLPPGEGRGEGGQGGKAAIIKVPVFDIRQLLAKPQQVNVFLAEHAPPVLDPFCGGGSIPLEAQRLGLRAYASDLNPVPVLITKTLIEIPPKFAGLPPVNISRQKKSTEEKAATVWHGGQGLAEDIRYYGEWMRDEATKRIGHLYPKVKITKETAKDRPDLQEYVGEELTVIAWLWARTVASPNPACSGTHVPLVKSFWLAKKPGRKIWIVAHIDKSTNSYIFDVYVSHDRGEPEPPTIGRKGGRCILSGVPIPLDYIRTEGKVGRMGSRLMAIVAEGRKGRVYLPPIKEHVQVVNDAAWALAPDAELAYNPFALRPPLYGLNRFSDLFTPRQLHALTTFCELVKEVRGHILCDSQSGGVPLDEKRLDEGGSGTEAYADAIATYLAFAIDKAADYGSAVCSWHTSGEKMRNTFGRQAIPMIWDYAESNPFSNSTGNWMACVDWVWKVPERVPTSPTGVVRQIDACAATCDISPPMISTDPPYYNNIDYADLSDFFYIWLRHSLGSVFPSLFSTVLTPKAQELVATPYRHNGDRELARSFFEGGLYKVFGHLQRTENPYYPLTVFYAFKQTEEDEADEEDEGLTESMVSSTGWQTMLEALIHAGFLIHGTWPMRTEMGSRMMSSGMNALASSIILVCRPRPADAPLATRREFITALRRELPEALKDLQHSNIAPVDLAQASIGPGMAVFTRYSKVMETDGSPMTVRTALGLINQSLDEVLAEQEGDFDGDTRWALAWFEQYGMEEGPFGVAETLSKAKNTAVNGLVEAGVIKARGGKVQLLKRDELPDSWNPATDKRLTVWEVTQHLIRTVDQKGESGAAALLHQLGGIGEIARDLAYRLYTICERKKWAEEALAYNGLVIAWSELTKLALAERTKPADTQTRMFE
ncbi:MAG: DUF1156 domain-containing protein [Planctomycetota bacterium]